MNITESGKVCNMQKTGIKQRLAAIEISKSELEIEIADFINTKLLQFQDKHNLTIDNAFVYGGVVSLTSSIDKFLVDRVDIDFDKANWLLINLED